MNFPNTDNIHEIKRDNIEEFETPSKAIVRHVKEVLNRDNLLANEDLRGCKIDTRQEGVLYRVSVQGTHEAVVHFTHVQHKFVADILRFESTSTGIKEITGEDGNKEYSFKATYDTSKVRKLELSETEL